MKEVYKQVTCVTSTMDDVGSESILKTGMNDLPVELLTQIFLNLTNNDDGVSLKEVCPLWGSVMESTVGVPKWVGKGSQENRIFEPLDVLGTIGVSDCTFSNVGEGGSNDDDVKKMTYRFPHLMRKASFDGPISPGMYQMLTNPLQHLTSLTFHISTLGTLEVDLQKQALSQTITSFSLTSGGDLSDGSESVTVAKNFVSICNTNFPKLKHFVMSLPYRMYVEFDLLSTIKHFLQNMKPIALEHFDFCLQEKFPVFRASLQKDFSEMDPSKTATFVIQDLALYCHASAPYLETILCREECEEIRIPALSRFETLSFIIPQSWGALKDLRVSLQNPLDVVDCSPLAFLTVLETLILSKVHKSQEGDGITNDWVPPDPSICNVTSLPASLKHLELRNILMDSSSVDEVSKGLPLLETLILTGIGTHETRGASIPSLLWILKDSPSIKALEIKGINITCRGSSLFSFFFPFGCRACPPKSHEPLDVGDKELLRSLISRNSVPFIKKKGASGPWELSVNDKCEDIYCYSQDKWWWQWALDDPVVFASCAFLVTLLIVCIMFP